MKSEIGRPRRNRVNPFAAFEAVTAKGLFLGNRGDIHAADGGPSNRGWAVKAWICCTLSPKSGNRIAFDRKGTYYPLFFLDEATAFAAGHRPCAMCRHRDYQRFKDHWHLARNIDAGEFTAAAEIDRVLHMSRLDLKKQQRRFQARLGDLPDGAMVIFPDRPGEARLVWQGGTWCWSHAGYDDSRPAAADMDVMVLTPAPLLEVFRAGYRPVVHPSAL